MKNMHASTKKLTITAVLMSMVIAMCSFSIPVPGGHMYLNDVIIVTAAILLDPFHAFIAGGIGAFLGDLFFYPTPMFVSLAVHGFQSIAISLCTRHLPGKNRVRASIIGVVIGWIITFTGYTLGRAFIYSTPAMAIAKLPFQILQTAVGSCAALLICWKGRIVELYEKIIGKDGYSY